MKKAIKITLIVSLVVVLALSCVLFWLFLFKDNGVNSTEFKNSMSTNVLSVEINKDTEDILTEDVLFTPARKTSDIYVRYKVTYEVDESTSLVARDLQKSAGLTPFSTTDAEHPNYGLKWVNVGEYYYLCESNGVPKVLTKDDYKNQDKTQYVFLAKDGLKKSELITADMFTEDKNKVTIKIVAESVLAGGENAEYKPDGTIIEGQDGVVDSPADIANKFVDKYPTEAFTWTFKVEGQEDKVVEVAYGNDVEAYLPTLDSTKFEFVEWNTQEGGKGVTVVASDYKSVSESRTLYAVLRRKFTVTFNANSGVGEDKTQTAYIAENQKLEANVFTKDGYHFLGWATTADAKVAEFADKVAVDEVSTTPGEAVTLYAVWDINRYTVKFDGNGATGGELADIAYTHFDETTLTANIFAKTGYTFLGWATSNDATEAKYLDGATLLSVVTDEKANHDQTVTLYAVWKEHSYTIKFDANSGIGETLSVATKFDDETALTENAFTKVGYHFIGWANTADATEVQFADKAVVSKLVSTDGETITLYAVWEANKYNVSYDGNGATSGAVENSEHIYDVEKTLNQNAYLKTGYTFLGWAKGSDAELPEYIDCASVENLTLVNGEDVTLYAVWQANSYTITFNINGGTGAIEGLAATYDSKITLTKNTITREGYTFLGWSTNKNDIAPVYVDEQEVINLAESGSVTLYAIWEEHTYTVIYDANGGVGEIEPSVFKYSVSSKLAKNTFTREHYEFLGWSTVVGATSSPEYTESKILGVVTAPTVSKLTAEKDGVVTLYAVWEAKTYNLTINYKDARVKEAIDLTVLGDRFQGGIISVGESVVISYTYDGRTNLETMIFGSNGDNVYVINTNATLTANSKRLGSNYKVLWSGTEDKTIDLYVGQVCKINVSPRPGSPLDGTYSYKLDGKYSETSKSVIYGDEVELEIKVTSTFVSRITTSWWWEGTYDSTFTATVSGDVYESEVPDNGNGYVTAKFNITKNLSATAKIKIIARDTLAQINFDVYNGTR